MRVELPRRTEGRTQKVYSGVGSGRGGEEMGRGIGGTDGVRGKGRKRVNAGAEGRVRRKTDRSKPTFQSQRTHLELTKEGSTLVTGWL